MEDIYVKYIKRVEIKGLWNYEGYDITWDLHPDVNIIAGDNGSGKSRILEDIFYTIKDELPFLNAIRITFNNDDIAEHTWTSDVFWKESPLNQPNIILLKTFDLPLQNQESIKKITNQEIKTTLDLMLWQLNDDYMNYQIEIGKRVINALKNKEENIEKINAKMDLFVQIVEQAFKNTHKKIDKNKNNLSFIGRENRKISPYMLSSGEKQLLVMLLQTLVQDGTPCIMLMDEPELSLHTDWQENLISNIRKLNPNVQLIIATHSPSIVAEGWENRVLEIPNF